MWPDQFGTFGKISAKPVVVSENALWDEYGFQEAEQAEYGSGAQTFKATAYRFHDSTGAMAAFQWQRPADARPCDLGKMAAETPEAVLLVFGNYLFRFEGRKPEIAELTPLLHTVPRLDESALPSVSNYLPSQNLTPNSERFVVGPVSLEAFEPRIPPSVAGFHYGVEAQLGKFRTPDGEMGLVVFSYPTPHIARERLAEFHKLPGAMAKRSGPLVAVIFSPSDPDEAERLLSQVRYQASLSWSEYVPTQRDNLGDLILTIFVLIGVLLALAVVLGLTVGGVRAVTRRWLGRSGSDEPMIMLHLSDR